MKIHKSNAGMKGVLDYNMKKVEAGEAYLLGTFNMEGPPTRHSIESTFAEYEMANIRTENPSFQLSINPDPDREEERLTKEEALRYASKLLAGLGYANQPAVIFEHDDIKRKHYHVVSIRTNANGRKIKDSFEKDKLQSLMKKYQHEFHYIVGNQGVAEEIPKEEKRGAAAARNEAGIPRFDPKGSDVRLQIDDIFAEAMRYEFTTWNQFTTIMHGMGVEADYIESGDGMSITFQGLDGKDEAASPFITEHEIGKEYYRLYMERAEACKKAAALTDEEKRRRLAERRRTAGTISYFTKIARTEKHLEKVLAKKGILMTLSRSSDGTLFGATFVDQNTRRAYKLSDLDRSFRSAESDRLITPVLKEASVPETGTWATNEKEYREQWLLRKKEEKQEARIQRKMDLAAMQDEPGRKATAPARRKVQPRKKRPELPGETNYLISALRAFADFLRAFESNVPGTTRKYKPTTAKDQWK